MTEQEWLAATDPMPMLSHVRDRGSCRKHRLFGCECCRRIWHLLGDPRSRDAIEAAERYADGHLAQQVLSAAQVGADRATRPFDRRNLVYTRSAERASAFRLLAAGSAAKAVARPTNFLNKLAGAIRQAAHYALLAEFGDRYTLGSGQTQHGDLLRCIFGNPFRPVVFDQSWKTDDAVLLARTMYESRDFSAMPILADALQDAGCGNVEILNHCRLGGTHVRGCWVLDLILGLE